MPEIHGRNAPQANPSDVQTVHALREGFTAPPDDSRIMMRWWWFGPFVEEAELTRELESMQRAGIGGVEVAFVYPLSQDDDSRHSEQLFPSDILCERLRHAAETASSLGMRFDVTLGSGWSFGGAHITGDLAARGLRWDRREIGHDSLTVAPQRWPGEVLLGAYIGAGSLQELPAEYVQLEVEDGQLHIPAGSGPRVILVAYSSPTGQNVKRASFNAEGPVLDHYSRAATEFHLRSVADKLLSAVPAESVTSVFCDSLEVYGADWTPSMFEEFRTRRGYELGPLLYLLYGDATTESADLRTDFFQTLSELYEEHFVSVIRDWAHEKGVAFRIQSYGHPPASLSSYRFADLFEGEGWGWKSLPQTRWAASAAHIYGREVVSSETWTWAHSPSFRANPLDLKGEAHEHFLLGVNQLIGHGWPYSAPDAVEPGWAFYASAALSDHNAWWPAMPALSTYLQRISWLLRQGEPVVDVGLYAPTTDAYLRFDSSEAGYLNLWLNIKQQIGPEVPERIIDGGYNFDLFDDAAVGVLDPAKYRAIVVANASSIPADTLRWLEKYVDSGGAVIALGCTEVRPGWIAVDLPEHLADALQGAVVPRAAFSPSIPDVGMVQRRVRGADVYFLANTGAQTHSLKFRPNTDASVFEQWNALSGSVLNQGRLEGGVDLVLHPYEAALIVAWSEKDHEYPLTEGLGAFEEFDDGPTLSGPWHLSYADSPQEVSEVHVPHRWEDEPRRRNYSGAATYETTFEVPSVPREDERLSVDFGPGTPMSDETTPDDRIRGNSYRAGLSSPVGEVAEVLVNGVTCGFVWAPPYRLDITDALKPGRNVLSVRVSNTSINALRGATGLFEAVDTVTTRFGQRFRMQDMDLIERPTRSGLLCVPQLAISRRR